VYSLLTKILSDQESVDQRPWLQLLDPESSAFLMNAYVSNDTRPKFAKVEMYKYWMADSLWGILSSKLRGSNAVWWKRKFEETLIPPLQLNNDKRLEYARIAEM
jgi:hypothetical protein